MKSFVLRLKEDLFAGIRQRAEKEGKSINGYCVELLEKSQNNADEFFELSKSCQKYFGSDLLGMVVFGSVARGTATKASDLDILIILDRSKKLGKDLYTQWDKFLERDNVNTFGRDLSPHFVHMVEDLEKLGSLWLEVALEGRVIFEQNAQCTQLLQKIRSKISEGHYKKSYSYGIPYWKKVA